MLRARAAPCRAGCRAEVPEPAAFGADAVLADIYARETSAHVSAVRAYLERESSASPPHALPEEIYRAVHTLSAAPTWPRRGTASGSRNRSISGCARPLTVRSALRSGDLILLADTMAAMESVATNLDESTGFFLSHESLLQRIAHAHAALDRRIADAAHAAHAAQQAQPPRRAVAQFDPEIASIFTEEATELLESAEAAIAAWRADPESAELRGALQRPLHTLKGGARMAGIQPMGDLSHELESLVLQIDQGAVAATPRPSTFCRRVLMSSRACVRRSRWAGDCHRRAARSSASRHLSQAAPTPEAQESAGGRCGDSGIHGADAGDRDGAIEAAATDAASAPL
jgi:chemosensory pili system protein ChpA (sensor histidine kinase/response regulator)